MSLFKTFSIKRVSNGESRRCLDPVATERPLGIFIQYSFKDTRVTESLAVTMCTPGNDRELAAGLLLSEGILAGANDIEDLRPLGQEPSDEILASLTPDVDFNSWKTARRGFLSSSCGVCGKRNIDSLSQEVSPWTESSAVLHTELICSLPEKLRAHQRGFSETGGLHAAAFVTSSGEVAAVFEDIGRHNALDKLCGWALLAGKTPLSNGLIFISSRASFELVQKAAMAGCPILATVGAPSSLAVDTAVALNMTLLCFVRDNRFNVYCGDWRIHS